MASPLSAFPAVVLRPLSERVFFIIPKCRVKRNPKRLSFPRRGDMISLSAAFWHRMSVHRFADERKDSP